MRLRAKRHLVRIGKRLLPVTSAVKAKRPFPTDKGDKGSMRVKRGW